MSENRAWLVYLKGKGMEWWDKQGRLVKNLDYPTELIAAQEVRDMTKFSAWVSDSSKLYKGKAVIVVSGDAEFVVNSKDGLSEDKDEWLQIPIVGDKLLKKVIITSDGTTRYIATNREVIEGIISGLKRNRIKVKGLFSEEAVKQVGKVTGFADLWKVKSNWRIYDYSHQTCSDLRKKSGSNRRLLIVLGLGIGLVLFLGVVIMLKITWK